MIGVGTFKLSPKAKEYVNQVLDSERLSYGYFTENFEREFAAEHDCRFAIMTNSGTSSLQIALAALKNQHGWKDGDEVIVPAVTFVATANVVIQNNLKPVFVDVDPLHYEIDPEKFEAAITPRTRCVIPVHLFGQPCDMDPIMQIAKQHDLRMVEDSCESMFVKYNGQSVGSFGDIACFSTYVAHLLTTGVGGLCTTNNPAMAVQLRSLMNHGRDSIYLNIDDDKDKSRKELDLIIKKRFSFVELGYSYRATEMEGALGLAEMETRIPMMEKRRQNGHFLMDRMSHLSDRIQLPSIREGNEHAFMMFPVVVRDEKKDELVSYLENNGIETRDMLPLTNQPIYKKLLGTKEEDYPVAKWVNDSGFYVGCHQGLTEADRDHIVDVFDSYYSGRKTNVTALSTALVVMARGEQRSAKQILADVPGSLFEEVIVADSSADPAFAAELEQKGIKVISKELSKGSMLKAALGATTSDSIVFMGADGADDPRDFHRILVRLRQGADMVIASRFLPESQRNQVRPSFRSMGNRFFSFLLSVLFDRNVTDCNNGFRGIRRDALEKISLKQTGDSIMFEMTVQVLRKKLKLSECTTIERQVPAGKSSIGRFINAFSFLLILMRRKHSGN